MIGSAASGAAAGPNATIVDTHLRNAQTVLYNSHDWARLRRYTEPTIGADQHLIDFPVTANPERITAISVLRGGVWSKPLPKGIPPSFYTYQSNKSWPQRWEPYDQIEIWPITDQQYSLRIFFIKALDRLTQDTDRFNIDDALVSIVATATLKAHYRQPDAQIHQKVSDELLIRLKSQSWGKTVFRPEDYEEEPLVKPVVV